MAGIEEKRLKEDKLRTKNWKRWGPYLSERQWGTVREDYSADGNCWDYFPHDHARSRAYRWGEDGLLGITDRQCRLCLALALWNGKDPILKERLFGLTGTQGNHGEDVKELYYYLDCTPTHSYMKALYKYPQREFPYADLEAENGRRGVWESEYEILDTGVFDDNRYFDVLAEYCKGSPNDILARYTISNRGPEKATIHVLPTLWFRNVWSWGDCDASKPSQMQHHPQTRLDKESIKLKQFNEGKVYVHHPTLGQAAGRTRLDSMDRYVDEHETPSELTEEGDMAVFGQYQSERRSGSFGRQRSFERRLSASGSRSRHGSGESALLQRQGSVGGPLERQTSTITRLPTLHRPHNGPFLDEDVFKFEIDKGQDGKHPPLLFTENNTNAERLFKGKSETKFVKDAFHESVIRGKRKATNTEEKEGTKCCAHYIYHIEPGQSVVCKVRLYHASEGPPHVRAFSVKEFDLVFQQRILEADLFYDMIISNRGRIQKEIARQAYAGLLWSKQFYYYIQKEWINGDKGQIAPPPSRKKGRNKDWNHLFNRDVISMPDKWEYPWYASWDLAFHMIPMANIDIQFAKSQLVLLLREWYIHPNGQIPAYEFSFDDVNPPVHAYAVLKVYKRSGLKGTKDHQFLARCFHKLVLNFTWWVNRKDVEGKNIFSGGFLGLDNIGVFDRSKPLPGGGSLAQADATAWMGFFCSIMLEISLILAYREPVYQDMASKFFAHYVAIIDAINNISELGLWDEQDGFYYDQVQSSAGSHPLKIKSMVGLVPLFCTLVLKKQDLRHHPGFHKTIRWIIENRTDLAKNIIAAESQEDILLAVVNKEKLVRLLGHILDEKKFLSPYGIRSLSKEHQDHPFTLQLGNSGSYSVRYEPGESESKLFGGNSNWRGPIWLPMNFLLIENLQRFDYFYGESVQVQCPTGSGNYMRLSDVAKELSSRLISLFIPDVYGYRPCHGGEDRYAVNPHFKQLNLFYEYFHGDTGRGCGASHQTGWTSLIISLLDKCSKDMEEHDSMSD